MSLAINGAEAKSPNPTVGYFPMSFPRDPVDVNIYLEHVLLGQIIRPLVEVGEDGAIIPGVAKHWKTSDQGKVITFYLGSHEKFSNGTLVTAKDVAFTLRRHLNLGNSQSKPYLELIKTLKIIDTHTIELTLQRPFPAILKALTRDHLGILPDGWTFNARSNEPFIGSGPYRAIRQKTGGYQLIANEYFENAERIKIKVWDVKFANTPFLPSAEEVDLLIQTPKEFVTAVRASGTEKFKRHRVEFAFNFFRSYAWRYPYGNNFKEKSVWKRQAYIIDDLIQQLARAKRFQLATGLIPEGVSGALPEREKCQTETSAPSTSRIHLKIAVIARDYPAFQNLDVKSNIEQKYNCTLDFFPFESPQFKDLPSKSPDFIFFSYAGGFYDPEGFLAVVSSLLSSDMSTVFGPLMADYQTASQSLGESERAKLFRDLNRKAVCSGLVVPGWRYEMVRMVDPSIQIPPNSMKYSTRLSDFSKGGTDDY